MGRDRLGKASIGENLGVTILFISIVFVIIILVLFLARWVFQRMKESKKCLCLYERIQKLQRNIFYNTIIRYCILNALKFNMTALVSLTDSNRTKGDVAISIIMLACMINIIPFGLLYVIIKHHDSLNEE